MRGASARTGVNANRKAAADMGPLKKAYPQVRAGGLATSVQKDNERFVGTIVLSVSYPRSLTPPTCI